VRRGVQFSRSITMAPLFFGLFETSNKANLCAPLSMKRDVRRKDARRSGRQP
jgi:hypothetical protein